MPALLFGSIGTVADTSELQREAFNRAFEQHGLAWSWDQDTYRELLASSGGANRVADFAQERGEEVDAAAIHETKSKIFRQLLGERRPPLRDGVADAVKEAKAEGFKLGLVTTTDAENVTTLLASIDGLDAADFDVVVDTSQVSEAKPSPAAYVYALDELGTPADEVVAIEDNVGGVESATQADITVVAFPGENNAGHDFGAANQVVDELDFAELAPLANVA